METEDDCLDGGQPNIKNNKQKTMSSNDQEKAGDQSRQASNYDMTHAICLFRKYLAKTQHDVGKSNMEESEAIKRHSSPPVPLIPTTFSCDLSRPPTLLERKLLPQTQMRGDREESKSTDAKSSKEQLTIFYAGTVNVYNNVPFDKAQAIMLLARESSTAKPLVDMTKLEVRKTPLHRPNLKSFCNLQSDLPIARKRSLQHFIEKRRQRLVDRPHYFNTKNEKPISNNENQTLPLSPFPSRLGFLSPLSTNKVVN